MTEAIDAEFAAFDRWPMSRRLDVLVTSNFRAVEAVRAALPDLERAAEGVAERLLAGGRIVYAGAGTSGRLALQDAAELPPTFGFSRTVVLLAGGAAAGRTALEGAEDDTAAAARAVVEADVGPADAMLGIAASGRTPYTVEAVRAARLSGAFTVGIANNPDSPLLGAAEVGVLLATGAEVIAGSTRMVAGTAQKIALNALSTAPMVELGALHGNLMVGMRPTNDKLRSRAAEIVLAATGRDTASVRACLEASEWDIRVAIVSLGADVSPAAARAALERHGWRVRDATTDLGDGGG